PRIVTLTTAAVPEVNHVLKTASRPAFFSSLLENELMDSRKIRITGIELMS
ncbi:hypothetical protein SAMN04487972_1601, partial [Paracoccus halophilus]